VWRPSFLIPTEKGSALSASSQPNSYHKLNTPPAPVCASKPHLMARSPHLMARSPHLMSRSEEVGVNLCWAAELFDAPGTLFCADLSATICVATHSSTMLRTLRFGTRWVGLMGTCSTQSISSTTYLYRETQNHC